MDWFYLLAVQGTLKSLLSITIWKNKFFGTQPSLTSNSHIHAWLLEKNIALILQTFVGKMMSLIFSTLSGFVIAFLPRSKSVLIPWLQSPSAVILEPKKIKSVTVSIVSPSICHEVMGQDAMILIFECWVLSWLFHSPLSFSSKGSLVLLHFLP